MRSNDEDDNYAEWKVSPSATFTFRTQANVLKRNDDERQNIKKRWCWETL